MAFLGKPLTKKQAMIWSLKELGKTKPQIMAELGISDSVVSKQLQSVRKKLGLIPEGRGASTTLMAPHTGAKPQAVLPDEGEGGVDEINATMKRLGFPERMRAATLKRMKVKYAGEETAPHAATDPELIRLHREKLHLAFSYMDDKVMAEASMRDLATAAAQLTEKLQLLEGKPTQIISDHERKQIHELLPLIIAEAQRRGLTIPGTVTEKVVESV